MVSELENKTIKFDKNLWNRYGELCKQLGMSRSLRLRNFVVEEVNKMEKALQRKICTDKSSFS